MPCSMTGFGRSFLSYTNNNNISGGWSHTWEIRSFNNRYLDLRWRLPFFLRSHEIIWEKIVRRFATRGRIELLLHLELYNNVNLVGVSLNRAQATAIFNQLTAFAVEQGFSYSPDINSLLNWPSLWEDNLTVPDSALVTNLEEGLILALNDWTISRDAEGALLTLDLKTRCVRLTDWLDAIQKRTHEIQRDKLDVSHDRMQQLLNHFNLEIDQNRLLQELILLVDRLDISEELTRIAAYLSLLENTLSQTGETGKRLDFILQECFREINTCGNKAQDVLISRLVVDFKAELEKCREQVQNLE